MKNEQDRALSRAIAPFQREIPARTAATADLIRRKLGLLEGAALLEEAKAIVDGRLQARVAGEALNLAAQMPLDKAVLYELYVLDQMTTVEVAKYFHCSHAHVSNELARHGIEARPGGTSVKLPGKETLYDLYWNQRYSLAQIGEMYGCDGSTIGRRLEKLGILRRPKGGGDPWSARESQVDGEQLLTPDV